MRKISNEMARSCIRAMNIRLEWALNTAKEAIKWDPDRLQKRIVQNKINKGFGISDMNQEFVLLYGEVGEAYDAWKHKEHLGEELADVAIYLMGIAELNNISLADEVKRKIEINEKRQYTVDERGNAFKIDDSVPEDRSDLQAAFDTLNATPKQKDCSTCELEDDKDSGECYECIKGIQDQYRPKQPESKAQDKDISIETINKLKEEVWLSKKTSYDKAEIVNLIDKYTKGE